MSNEVIIIIIKKKSFSQNIVCLLLYISGSKERKAHGCHINAFGGASGTLGGDETIVALQLSAPAM